MKKFLAIAGNIGVGKTSLTQFLCSTYDFEPVYEPFATNPYLDDFYGDMKAWAFHSQLYFLTHKFRLHLELSDTDGSFVMDRTIYEDAEIFATNLARGRYMTKRDYGTYMEMYGAMKQALQPPDLLIYLQCDVRSMRKRIKGRGRPSEQKIPTRYLRRLNDLYEEWIASYDASEVLVWESGKLDYLTNLVDQVEFRREIERFL